MVLRSLITVIGIDWQETFWESVLKVIVKYRNHASMFNIEEVCQKNSQFYFRCVDKDEILKDILYLDASKAYQDSDIPSRIIKENADIFTGFLHFNFSNSTFHSEFSSILKLANITLVFKKLYTSQHTLKHLKNF